MTNINYRFFADMVLLVCFGIGLILMLDAFPYQIDDAFITWRYAQNFLSHGVFSFNPTGVSVEGYSSQIWFWFAVVWGYIFGPEKIHLLGPVGGAFSYIALVTLFKKRSSNNPVIASIMAALVALVPSHISYAVTGLETVFFVLLVSLFAFSLLGKLNVGFGCLAAFLACWARPEAPWLMVMLVIAFILQRDNTKKSDYLKLIVAEMLGYASLLFFRWYVFGDWVPNTYYAKSPDLQWGLDYLQSAFLTPWYLILFLTAFISVIVSKRKLDLAAFFMGSSWLAVGVVDGGDWMTGLRFFLPGVSLMILSLEGVLEKALIYKKFVPNMILTFMLLIFGVISIMSTKVLIKKFDNHLVMGRNEAHWFKQWLVSHDIKSVAAIDIGELGYSTNLDVLDLAGLTDKYIAHLPGKHLHKSIPASYLLKRMPEVVVIITAQ